AAGDRRASADSSRVAFARLLSGTIAPLLIQTASILKAEGELCQVHTPSDSAKIVFNSSHEDFIEFMLDTAPPAHVIGRGSARRKGGTMVEDRIVGVGKPIDEINDEDVLAYLLPELRKILK
nr:hypothetical protein [Acidobacteriota bacterium]MBP8274371.1 hypothetical protein [Acidobacteriota bacterium]